MCIGSSVYSCFAGRIRKGEHLSMEFKYSYDKRQVALAEDGRFMVSFCAEFIVLQPSISMRCESA